FLGRGLSRAERYGAGVHAIGGGGGGWGGARATLRLVLSHMLHCEPREVGVGDEPGERIVVTHPLVEGAIHVDVAYSGIWIVIAVASTRIGLGLTVEASGAHDAAARKHMWEEAARIGRTRAGDDGSPADWRALTLPMPGGICGVLVVDKPVARGQAFGWERPFEAEGSAAAS
ncbi:hypothetical protein, partial [Caballeronia sp. INDeC2]|uniref:hypothetical protein n=1 Tax=Caballeronia sp. INDeC2 TaxID=2921747 RepID=UPI0020278F4D